MVLSAGTLRPMTPADVAVVAELEAAVFSEPWSPAAFFEELESAGRHYVVVEGPEGVVGYAGMMIVRPEAHIMTIAVADSHRRSGVGSKLLLALIEDALASGVHHLTLEVRPSNDAGRALYRRFGFAAVGTRPSYYRDEDAIVMWALDVSGSEYSRRLATIKAGL